MSNQQTKGTIVTIRLSAVSRITIFCGIVQFQFSISIKKFILKETSRPFELEANFKGDSGKNPFCLENSIRGET